MPSLPHLPFGLEYAAVGVFFLALVGAVVQQFFADRLHAGLARLWRRVSGRPRKIRSDEWTRYRAWVARTYNTMKLGFLQDVSITLDDVYVPLQYEQDGQRIDVYREIQGRLRTVVVGAAGAGKSMLLRHSMLQWAKTGPPLDRVPVLIELARYNRGGRNIQQLIVETLAREDQEGDTRRKRRRRPARPLMDNAEQVVATALATNGLCVFLDGLDEVVTERRAEIALDIKEFAEQHPTCQIVVTCRDAVYDNDLHPVFDGRVLVAGFDDAGIRHFLRLWFSQQSEPVGEDGRGDAVGNRPADPRELIEQLMAALRANPTLMRLARSPLMLTMITSLHDADPGAGPMLTNSRAEFYEQAVTHLLRRDRDLGRHRDLARYRAGHKLMALRAIALAAQGATSPGSDRRVISEEELYAAMSRLLPRFRLTEADLPKMINEIVDRSGLLIRIDDTNLLYEFAHLTLQEYLAAVELADAPDRLLALYRDNPGRWRETVKLWCAGANRDASELVRKMLAGDARDRLLALECVAEARQIDEDLATRIVNQFVVRLGTDMPDRHLVLVALGAVAGDPGPIGHALFSRLRDEAMRGGPGGEDAIVALAESRQRAAIEILDELAPRTPAANAALRSTGELAIPVLVSRARAGSVTAIDDLAAVGTPAAAVAIAEQLWSEQPVAIRAAWRLATLISAPDVESELNRFDPAPFHRAGSREGYDWLWAPFVPAGSRGGMAVTMGRLGWLIDRSTETQAPEDLGTVDPRLALGLGAREESFSTGPLPDTLHHQLVEADRRTDHPRRRVESPLVRSEVESILDAVASADPHLARRLATEVITARTRDGVTELLLLQLPTPALVELAKRLWQSGFRGVTGIRDWRALNERPESPKALVFVRNTVVTIAALLGIFALGLALTRSVGTLIGWWAWGPPWFAALLLLGFAITVAVAVRAESDPSNDNLYAVFGFVGFATAAGSVVVALPTVAGWLGWLATVAVTVVLTGAVVLFSTWTARRQRAVANPYRAILRWDERGTGAGATVVARAGPTVRGQRDERATA
ncbi:NACHT domain-containing protein [Plantactinospora sp. CA-290183]|uniref:NACHT domain-containing protein n=1 Tax=Plantactinospora sp. CA-290183 TaxID=3240006 RepID=UPI003D8EA5BF